MSRRDVLRWWGPVALTGIALTGAGVGLAGRDGRHRPDPETGSSVTLRDWRPKPEAPGRIAVGRGAGPVANLEHALAALGGIEAFVRPQERVVIKPNCAWDRRPEQAANTNPELVAAIVRLCLQAGAGSVTVADNSCHDPERVLERSGIGEAGRAAGADVVSQRTAGTVAVDLGGIALGRWEVLRPIVEADRVINVPIVKHHSLARATLGMKNWFGAVVGNRSSLHQRIDQVMAELGAAFRPTLTVVDATRVLIGGGPTGGSLDLVSPMDQVAVATDPVAADAWGASLLELEPRLLPHLAIARRLALGTSDWRSIQVEV
jgi:uncharacterized protein (DUF362 family)